MGHKDLQVEAVALRDALAALECAPLRTPKNPGLHDAWKRLVSQRAARGRAVLEALLRPASWTFDDEDRATSAAPGAWALVRREVPRLYAAMSAALAGLLHAAPHATPSGVRLRIGRVAVFGPEDRLKSLRARQADAFEHLGERRDEPDRDRLHLLAKGLRALQKRVRRVLARSLALLTALTRSEQKRLVERVGEEPEPAVGKALAALRRARLDLDAYPGRPTSALALRFEQWWAARDGVLDALASRGAVERGTRRRSRREGEPPTLDTQTPASLLDETLAPGPPGISLEVMPTAAEPGSHPAP